MPNMNQVPKSKLLLLFRYWINIFTHHDSGAGRADTKNVILMNTVKDHGFQSQTILLKCCLQHGIPSITLGKLLISASVSTIKTGVNNSIDKSEVCPGNEFIQSTQEILFLYVSMTNEMLRFKGVYGTCLRSNIHQASEKADITFHISQELFH